MADQPQSDYARIQQLEEALRLTAQSLAWLAFGECRGWHDTLPTAHEALEAAKSALGVMVRGEGRPEGGNG